MSEDKPSGGAPPEDEQRIIELIEAFHDAMQGGEATEATLGNLIQFPLPECFEWKGTLHCEPVSPAEMAEAAGTRNARLEIDPVDYEIIWLSPLFALVQYQNEARLSGGEGEAFDFMSFYAVGKVGTRKGPKRWRILFSWQGEMPEWSYEAVGGNGKDHP